MLPLLVQGPHFEMPRSVRIAGGNATDRRGRKVHETQPVFSWLFASHSGLSGSQPQWMGSFVELMEIVLDPESWRPRDSRLSNPSGETTAATGAGLILRVQSVHF